jgi:hypothetical protein
MEETTLKQLWLNACQEQKIEIDIDKFIESINQKMSIMEKRIKMRDRREIIVSALLVPLFGWFFIKSPQILSKIGSAVIIAACFMVIFRLKKARKINVPQDPASEVKHHLMVSLQQVRKQITLLSTVLWWYLLPFFIGVLCFYYSYPVSFLHKSCYTLIVATVYGYIYYINKKVVRKRLRPMETSILETLEELTQESN